VDAFSGCEYISCTYKSTFLELDELAVDKSSNHSEEEETSTSRERCSVIMHAVSRVGK
jgi:hypothetical protein